MEALSPRDANVRPKPKQTDRKGKAVEKAAPARSLQREKDHPPPPPPQVLEPPSSDRHDGAVYNTGRLLGRGGFAICYEGKLGGTKQVFALKIVKSHMPQKKMEQKVCSRAHMSSRPYLTSTVPNRASNPLEDEACKHCSIPPGFLV